MSGLVLSNLENIDNVQILDEVNKLKDEIYDNRRWFHMVIHYIIWCYLHILCGIQYPELSFKEVNTAKKVVELLKSYGIEEIFESVGMTGVVAIIRGGKPGKCIALRADMDGLPVSEVPSNDNFMLLFLQYYSILNVI